MTSRAFHQPDRRPFDEPDRSARKQPDRRAVNRSGSAALTSTQIAALTSTGAWRPVAGKHRDLHDRRDRGDQHAGRCRACPPTPSRLSPRDQVACADDGPDCRADDRSDRGAVGRAGRRLEHRADRRPDVAASGGTGCRRRFPPARPPSFDGPDRSARKQPDRRPVNRPDRRPDEHAVAALTSVSSAPVAGRYRNLHDRRDRGDQHAGAAGLVHRRHRGALHRQGRMR